MSIALLIIVLILNGWQSYRLDQAIARFEAALDNKIIWPDTVDWAKWMETPKE